MLAFPIFHLHRPISSYLFHLSLQDTLLDILFQYSVGLSTTQPSSISPSTHKTFPCAFSWGRCHRFSRWLSFFRMVWIRTRHVLVISPFALFSYSVFKEPWTLAMLSRSKGYPLEPMPCIRFHHRCRSHVLSFVHCAYIVARCSYIVKSEFSFWFSLSSYHSVVNLLPVAFSMCGVLSSSTLSTLHYRWIVCRKVRAVRLAFRPCHPWLSRL